VPNAARAGTPRLARDAHAHAAMMLASVASTSSSTTMHTYRARGGSGATRRGIIHTRANASGDSRAARERFMRLSAVPTPRGMTHARVGVMQEGRARHGRRCAVTNPTASKSDGGSRTEEIEKCLEDEECKSETLKGLEAALASEKEADVAASTTGSAVTAEAKKPKKFVNAKTYDEEDGDDVVVSEPPLNFGRLKSVGTIARSFEIWSFVFAFVFRRVFIGVKWSYKGGYTEEKRIARLERLANWLRLGLLRLGPTFIKIGQQFSTRVDVLSPQFIRELEKLQDRVPPFPTAMAKEILQSELGGPVEQFFDNFEDTPLAAASLGQVHRAQLKITGEQVIVKVQRPGLKEIFDVDLKNLRVIAKWLQNVDPKTDGAARDWVAIFDETARVLYDEVDYTNEAKNAEEFRAQFAGSDWIKVPRIYWDFTKTKTLCMEYAPAVKINDVEKIKALGIDPDRMARLAVEAYLQQVLRFGFFHADPHPGNVAVDAGDPEGLGRLVVYDYGMMGRIPTQTRDGLLDLFYATYEGQSDSAVKALMKMGVLVDTGADLTAVRRTADFFLSQFDARINAQKKARDTNKEEFEAEFKAPRTKEEKKAVRKRILTNIGEDLLVVSKDQPFRFPAEFTFVVVSIDGSKFDNDATVCTDENTLSR
jgi:predicted unusual protein kinase regulating ubiquinone biosynthesis (AarF/ABC1/UbiB family)